MSNTVNRQASIDSRRIALEREISIRVPRFDSFVTEYSSNISTTGMFIVSDKPQPPGTSFSFEFSVADDWKLIRGKGQVVWTRYRDEGPERPPGMGIKFLELDAQSRRLIRWIVEKHIREGGKPFELDELRSVIDQALEQVLEAEEALETPTKAAPSRLGGRTAGATSSTRVTATTPTRSALQAEKKLLPLILTAVTVLAIVGLLFWLTEWLPGQRERSEQAATSERGLAVEAGASTIEESASPTGADETPGAEKPPPAGDQDEIADEPQPPPPVGSAYRSASDAVKAWADAWSDQSVERYVSSYSRDFRPPQGQSRSRWEAQRRERLKSPGYIKVSISGLEADRIDDEHVRVRFNQSYRSDRFSDIVRKQLDLVWEDGSWKIEREQTGES